MRSALHRLGDAASLLGLALVAGGGTAFFLFAHILFREAPDFTPHARFDAGRVVGPIVGIANGLEIAVAALVLFVAQMRRGAPEVFARPNGLVLLCATLLLAVAIAERFWLLPEIVSIREQLGRTGFDGDVVSPERKRFGMLHGIDMLAHALAVLLAWTSLLLERASVQRGAP